MLKWSGKRTVYLSVIKHLRSTARASRRSAERDEVKETAKRTQWSSALRCAAWLGNRMRKTTRCAHLLALTIIISNGKWEWYTCFFKTIYRICLGVFLTLFSLSLSAAAVIPQTVLLRLFFLALLVISFTSFRHFIPFLAHFIPIFFSFLFLFILLFLRLLTLFFFAFLWLTLQVVCSFLVPLFRASTKHIQSVHVLWLSRAFFSFFLRSCFVCFDLARSVCVCVCRKVS